MRAVRNRERQHRAWYLRHSPRRVGVGGAFEGLRRFSARRSSPCGLCTRQPRVHRDERRAATSGLVSSIE